LILDKKNRFLAIFGKKILKMTVFGQKMVKNYPEKPEKAQNSKKAH